MVGVADSFAQETAPSIILATNKGSYLPGDVVQLTGATIGQSASLVAIQVKDSGGNLILIRTIPADQNGNFALQFKIPSTATSGNFTILASARINGFVVTQTRTISTAVPEFGPLAMLIFVMSISSFIIISKKGRAVR
jgi:predicted secreted protein with PEFG-CTERM motif